MNTAQTTKNIAQKIARQMAQEPLEVLKNVREQTVVFPPTDQNKQEPKPPESQNNDPQEHARAVRRMEAYLRELEDIRKMEKFKELQRRISQGESIPLEDYPELTIEQKQVLRAQMEAVVVQNSNLKNQNSGFQEPAAKKGRRLFNFGKKTAMKREQTHVEKPNPPSG